MPSLDPPDRDPVIVRDREVQDRWLGGQTYAVIAREMDLSITTVQKALHSATGQRLERIKDTRRQGLPLELDEFERADMRRVYRNGFQTLYSIAKMYNVSIASAYRIISEEET